MTLWLKDDWLLMYRRSKFLMKKAFKHIQDSAEEDLNRMVFIQSLFCQFLVTTFSLK